VPCFSPDPPTGLGAAAAGANQINLTWTSSDPIADTFSVYRAVGACPQPSYELIASGVTATSYLDTTVSGGITYSYVVTATDVTGGCESASSSCAQAQTTGTCRRAAGLRRPAVRDQRDPLHLHSRPGVEPGDRLLRRPATYSVYRSTTPASLRARPTGSRAT